MIQVLWVLQEPPEKQDLQALPAQALPAQRAIQDLQVIQGPQVQPVLQALV